ncbi:MAG: tetratricopeptide repeat protein [Pirellulales bacterium]
MRRLNIKFAVILGVGLAVSTVGIYLLHGYQVEESAKGLPERAAEFKKEGRYEEAYGTLRRYTILTGTEESWDQLADFLIEWFDKLAPTPEEKWRRAYPIAVEELEFIVGEYPTKTDYRRKLAELYGYNSKKTRDAAEHFRRVVEQEPDDIKSRVQLAICEYLSDEPQARQKAIEELYSLVGYDAESRTFDPAKGKAKDQLEAYQRLSVFLRQEAKDNDMADRVLDAMIEANPKDHRAYLIRAQMHSAMQRNDQAQADIDKSLELDAKHEDLDVLLVAANVALQRREFERANELLTIALKKFPANASVYLYLIQLEQSQGHLNKAMFYVLEGLAEEENKNNIYLLGEKAWLQAYEGNLAAAMDTVKIVENAAGGTSTDDTDRLRAFVAMQERRYVDALVQFEELRPRITAVFRVNQVDAWLAFCYGQLDEWDMQIEAYQRALNRQPTNIGVMLSLAKAHAAIGKTDEAFAWLKKARKEFGEDEEGVKKFATTSEAWGVYFEMALRRELRKAEKNRDWTDLNNLFGYVEKYKGAPPLLIEKYRLDILLRDNKVEEVRTKLDPLLAQARAEPTDAGSLALELMNVRLLPFEKDKGIDKALEALDDVEKRFGDILELRLQRAQLIAQRRGPEALRDLAELETNVEKLDRAALWRGLAVSYASIGATDEAERLWRLVIAADSNDLRTRIALFEQALKDGDDREVDQALEEIEKLMGKDSDTVHYRKAQRLVAQSGGSEKAEALLAEARSHLKIVFEKRPRWHEPVRLEAQICRLLDDRKGAIENLNKALDLGPADAYTVEALARLYYDRAEYSLARKAIARLGEARMPKPLRQLEAELALVEAREKSAPPRQAVEMTSELIADLEGDKQITPQDYMWQANMLSQFRQPEQAEDALRKATALNPNDVNVSFALLQHLASQRKFNEASDVVRDLELKLTDDVLASVRPRCYQMIGKLPQAERLLKDLVVGDPKNLANLQAFAEFYQNTRRPQQAEQQVDKMLAIGGPRLHPNLVWARRAKASYLAGTGEFPDFEEAMKLLAYNYVKGEPTLADMALEVQFLSARGQFIYSDQAIKRLLEIRDRRVLPTNMQLTLAELYYRTNQWDKCREELYNLCREEGHNPAVLSRAISMFLELKDLHSAQSQLNNLVRLVPDSPETVLLQARIDAAQGDAAKAVAGLTKIIPIPAASPEQESDNDLQLITIVAGELQRLKQNDKAEALYRRIVAAKPGSELALGVFLASTGVAAKIDEALDMGDRFSTRKEHIVAMNLGTGILGAAGKKLTPAQIERVKGWYAAAQRDEASSLSVKLQTAQMHDLLGDHKQAVDIYREVLDKKDLDVSQRGLILNNAAFVGAVNGGDLDEALGWAEESLRLLGLRSEVLDTRGIVHYIRGEYAQAVTDLRMSVKNGPTAAKNFHLALAESAAGNTAEAATAWRDAQTRGIDPANLSAREREWFAKLKASLSSPDDATTDVSNSGS